MKRCQFTHRFSQCKIPACSSTGCSEHFPSLGPASYRVVVSAASREPHTQFWCCSVPSYLHPESQATSHRDRQRFLGLAVGFQSAFLVTHISMHSFTINFSWSHHLLHEAAVGRGLANKSGRVMGPSLSPATQRAELLFVKGTEIFNTWGYKGENVPRKPHPKYVACTFLMVLAQRPTVWALQPVARKDSSGNSAYSTTSPPSSRRAARLAPASKQQQGPGHRSSTRFRAP